MSKRQDRITELTELSYATALESRRAEQKGDVERVAVLRDRIAWFSQVAAALVQPPQAFIGLSRSQLTAAMDWALIISEALKTRLIDESALADIVESTATANK